MSGASAGTSDSLSCVQREEQVVLRPKADNPSCYRAMATDIKPPRQISGISELCSSCLQKCSALCLRKQDIQLLHSERWIEINNYNYKPGSLVPGNSRGCVLCTILSQLGNDEDWIQAKWSIRYSPCAACDFLDLVDFDQLRIDFYESKSEITKSKVFDVRASAGLSSYGVTLSTPPIYKLTTVQTTLCQNISQAANLILILPRLQTSPSLRPG